MALNTNGRNAMLQGGLGNAVTHVSLHTGAPGDAGSNEIPVGVYARQVVVWTAVAAGKRSNSAPITFTVPAGSEVLYIGFWGSLAAGTFFGFSPLNGSQVGSGSGDNSANTIQSPAHNLSNGDKIVLANIFSESLPGGLSEDVVYFVRDSATNTFKVALTSGGTAVNITSDGELVWQQVRPESFGADAPLTFATGLLILDGGVV